MKKTSIFLATLFALCVFTAYGCSSKNTEEAGNGQTNQETDMPKVYFTKEITPEALMKIYKALGREAKGNNVAIKVSTGEPGGKNYLKPALIGDLVKSVNGTIIECNTAYGGNRATTELHLKAARDHGFFDIADVDIMDADGDVGIPVVGGKHLKEDMIGKNYLNYDFTVVLSHFKGHAMGGFGGAIKNISIGIASSRGKVRIHSAGASDTDWGNPKQEDFLESMAEAAKAVADHAGDRILYINVMNNLSVDCDCDSSPADPEMHDVGILASLDPVALDKACVDQVYASNDHGKIHLIERMESRNGIHTLVHAENIGMGSQNYELVSID
ncbi:MAG: DUF362 domain-containing protein [Rikenellaceae bacterium]|nr:DUF362 domain-containing protein [Rikenellaceae bacterium]MCC8146331.1 DUF362 domain-containing protein [Bacteroidales bacterium]